MYTSREVMHCKPGKAKDLVAKFKKVAEIQVELGYSKPRLYTDISGENYWTVVIEQDVENIDDLAKMSRTFMNEPRIGELMKDYHELVLNGRREIFKVE